MTYIIFRLLCNLLDLCQASLFKIAKHWDSFFTHCNSSNDTNDADADDVVYEVIDDNNMIIERPAESVQAELSAHSPLKSCIELTF
jgi:hypothetical protein